MLERSMGEGEEKESGMGGGFMEDLGYM